MTYKYGNSTEITINDIDDSDKVILLKNLKRYINAEISMGQLGELANLRKLQTISVLGSIYNL